MKQNIVIVGGGTAGWLTGALLQKKCGKYFDITLVADENVGNIGVGEATIPSIKNVFDILEIDEKQWLTKSNGSFKLGIKFESWGNKDFIFPYDSMKDEFLDGFIKGYVNLKQNGLFNYSFSSLISRLPFLLKNNLFYKETKKDLYAYHFDTNLLGEFLKEYCLDRGLKYINDNIIDIDVFENNIKSLILKSGKILKADLFIDCSGFRSLLLEGVLKEEFISFSDQLLCDSCIVNSYFYDKNFSERKPYTTAKAMKNGWMWKIPLKDRLSVGYVFSSKYATNSEIEEEIQNEIKLNKKRESRYIKIKNGYHKKSWIGNVVAVGLSSNFIEPLESTGIFLTYSTIFRIIDILGNIEYDLRKDFYNEKEIFNRLGEMEILNIKEFIKFHYFISERKEKFWLDAKSVSCSKNFDFIENILIGDFSRKINIQEEFLIYLEKNILDKLKFPYFLKYSDSPCFLNACYYFILFGIKDIKVISKLNNKDLLKLQYYFYERYKKILLSLKGKTEDYNSFLEKYYLL